MTLPLYEQMLDRMRRIDWNCAIQVCRNKADLFIEDYPGFYGYCYECLKHSNPRDRVAAARVVKKRVYTRAEMQVYVIMTS